ncbi:hypothetical protein [Dyadobacter sp.]|uniref:hypothetical protein n=1 Tax=Dyadobacter sp. TaxID=1914288 RepID=UPI003F71B9D2
MDFATTLASAVLTATTLYAVSVVARFLRGLFKDEMKVINRRTGKSVTLGKHHSKNQDQRLLEVLK